MTSYSSKRAERKYAAIWQQLKRDDYCYVSIMHPALVQRVKAGVIKEKNKDVGFKLLNDNGETFRLKITYNSELGQMYFCLVQRYGIAEKEVV